MRLLSDLHTKIGDLWWYSALIFISCRAGDVIQAFIGLWLVPRYVGPQELGAVIPLQTLAALFAVPLAVIATVFAKFVNVYATRGEEGKVKCLIRDVLAVAIATFAVSIAVAYLVVPHFYVRLNVISGMLTALILAAGFTSNLSSLFSSALQGLKMFKAITVQNLIGAPIRLVTLLVAMPIRALSGYVLGQATPPTANSVLAAVSLRRRFANVSCDTSWRKDLPEILRYLWPVAVCTIFGTLFASICTTVYRQRLPEVESAAHYVLTRFAETAGYVGASMTFVLQPLSAEAHERGRETSTALRRTILTTLAVSVAEAAAFAAFGRTILSMVAVWREYADYAYLLPPLVFTTGAAVVIGAIITHEMACRRFGATALITGFNAVWTILLVGFSGFAFFRGILPDATVDFVESLHVNRLSVYTWASLVSVLAQLALLHLFLCLRRR